MNTIQNLVELLISLAIVAILSGLVCFLAMRFAFFKRITQRPSIAILALLAIFFSLNMIAQQNVAYQANGATPFSLGPLTYGRNIYINTGNDSEGFIIGKPSPTNGLSNNFVDFYTGSTPTFTVGPSGALSNLSLAAQTNTANALGIEPLTNVITVATANNTTYTSYFPVPFASGTVPTVVLAHSSNLMWINQITSNFVAISNQTGTNGIQGVAYGQSTY